MRGLKDIADASVLFAKAKGTSHRFIQPDNSFGTWFNIIERPDTNDKNRREIFTLEGKPENRLHLTAEDVKDFYKKNKPTATESWYITPVGNPSGTTMSSSQLLSTCQEIVKQNPDAVIILDVVYVRTLLAETGKQLLKGLAGSPELLEHIVFVESVSKSHGLCRERLGIYFSANEKLFTRLHTANIAFSAGPGVYKDYQFLSIGNSSPVDKQGVSDLHHFWQKERKGVVNFLLNGRHSGLFAPQQKHIVSADLDNPCTLYVLLKTASGVKAQDIFVNTGALGVDTPMLSGHHVRFSMGTVREPTYSKFL